MKELKDEYNDLETTFNQTVLEQSAKLPDEFKSLKEDDVYIKLKKKIKFFSKILNIYFSYLFG